VTAPHLPRPRDPWPEPERPVLPHLSRPSRLAYLAALAAELVAFVRGQVRWAWDKWRGPAPLRGRR